MMILGTGLIISLLLIPGNPLWGFLATVLLAGCISLGTFWGFTVRGLFVSPLMPLVTLSVDFVLLILINLKRAFARAKFLRLAKIKAEEMSRFKSDFLANMSHEIRTPMNAVIGLSYLALQTKLTAKQSDYLNKIQGAGKMLLGIINDILDYSKIEAQKLDMEEIDFSLDDVLDNLSSLIDPLVPYPHFDNQFFGRCGFTGILLGDIPIHHNAPEIGPGTEYLVPVFIGKRRDYPAVLEFL